MDSEAPASSQLVEPSTTPIFKMASHCHNLFVMAVGLQFSFHCYDQSFSSPVMFYFPCPVFLFPHLIFCALLCFICSLALVYVSLFFFVFFFPFTLCWFHGSHVFPVILICSPWLYGFSSVFNFLVSPCWFFVAKFIVASLFITCILHFGFCTLAIIIKASTCLFLSLRLGLFFCWTITLFALRRSRTEMLLVNV